MSGSFEGEIYVVRRANVSMTGAIVDADHIAGASLTDSEQNTLASTNELLTYGETTSDVVPEASHFQMVRLPDGAGCPDLLEAADQLFPPR